MRAPRGAPGARPAERPGGAGWAARPNQGARRRAGSPVARPGTREAVVAPVARRTAWPAVRRRVHLGAGLGTRRGAVHRGRPDLERLPGTAGRPAMGVGPGRVVASGYRAGRRAGRAAASPGGAPTRQRRLLPAPRSVPGSPRPHRTVTWCPRRGGCRRTCHSNAAPPQAGCPARCCPRPRSGPTRSLPPACSRVWPSSVRVRPLRRARRPRGRHRVRCPYRRSVVRQARACPRRVAGSRSRRGGRWFPRR